MKTQMLLFFSFITQASLALALTSPFPSEVEGLSINNSHVLAEKSDGSPLVVRGMAPSSSQVSELKDIGIEKVIIFKNETKNEVQEETDDLLSEGYSANNVIRIPFLWKDIADFKSACEMTVEALLVIKESEEQNQAVYFHCTVGEDRTGYLAGLYEVWKNPATSLQTIFQDELCQRGYEAGDHHKPRQVVSKIRETLTPTFMKMASLLHQWKAQGKELSQGLCPQDLSLHENVLQCR